MNKKTVAATLGSVDAFASHSWSDDGNAKFDILQEWAGDDIDKKLIWLDKVWQRNCGNTCLQTASTLFSMRPPA